MPLQLEPNSLQMKTPLEAINANKYNGEIDNTSVESKSLKHKRK
jgi:hypothetical protein